MLSKQQVRNLRTKLEPFLDAISEEIGYRLTLGNCRFGEVATFKLEAAPIGKDGQAISSMGEDFKKRAHLYGLKVDDLGKSFSYKDRTFTITGLAPRGQKYPILADTVSGKRYKFSTLFIRTELARKESGK